MAETGTGAHRFGRRQPQVVSPGGARVDGDELGAQESAVLDEAHLGDIQGAFGTIREADAESRRSWKGRLLTLLAILGPGIIVMVGDNDAGGVSTYAQAAQNYGLTLLWTLPLLIPVLIVNQEMVVRLGAVTGVGHARLINERFGKFWGAFSVGDLFILNFLTITTEFIGVNLALAYFGVSADISVPIAAVALVAMTATGSFRRWERFMFVFIFANLLVIPLAVFSHPHASAFLHGFAVPGVHGGFTSTSVLLIIAIVGTTVAPWQLFFQQSNIVDKRITPRWISYERADTVLGSVVTVVVASLIMAVVAAAFTGHAPFGHFTNAEGVAHGLSRFVGHASGAVFSIILLNASLIGAASVTLATSYAFGDVFGVRHSLHRSWREAKFFYASFTIMVAGAAAIVLTPGAPLGLITTGVQALAGVLLPSATVFLLLLCNDKEVLGPWVNRPWLNVIAFGIVSILLVLSLVLMATTVFPHLQVRILTLVMGSALALTYLVGGFGYWRILRQRPPEPPMPRARRDRWRMPPLARLQRPVWSRGRQLAMYSLRGYLVLAVALLAVKAFQLGVHK
ncbi:MAG TPA: NRAMP family divalent metal transporter [Acidimicrobiales bacterium]|jgi:Mn2+/Fe2+ NRAMP family transporter|nr:NRAMP family divalent metal transporter [Acidimicrobiales bacterium]